MALKNVLDEILGRARARVAEDKKARPFAELKARIKCIAPVVSFSAGISHGFGLIAEIKQRSPSQGEMLNHDIKRIAQAYQDRAVVHAVSVLTNRDDFGMGIDDLWRVRNLTSKPILRKDFIFDDYQVYEARAYGADAILLMASVLKPSKLRQLFDLAQSLGMDVLCECRDEEEITSIPAGARIYGINSRKMKALSFLRINRYRIARLLRNYTSRDQSVQHSCFELIKRIPKNAIKVAESGLAYHDISSIRDDYGYDSALVGTAILNAPKGVEAALDDFANALHHSRHQAPVAEHRNPVIA